jgi:hypothetical protein
MTLCKIKNFYLENFLYFFLEFSSGIFENKNNQNGPPKIFFAIQEGQI